MHLIDKIPDTALAAVSAWILAVSVIAVILTAADKIKAKKQKYRISEKALMICGLFGGAAAEYLTMKIIRHKTLHKRFMIGLPLIVVFHLLLAAVCLYLLYR